MPYARRNSHRLGITSLVFPLVFAREQEPTRAAPAVLIRARPLASVVIEAWLPALVVMLASLPVWIRVLRPV